MNVHTIVTLEGIDRYYLASETTQNNTKYFLANKLDENDHLTKQSFIFEENKSNNNYYLNEVTDEKILSFLTAVFTANFVGSVDEIQES